MERKTKLNMALIVYLLTTTGILLIVQATASCPRECTCRDVTIDAMEGKSVDCSHEFMEVFPSAMSTEVLSLDFSHNSLDRMPNRIGQLTEVRHLNLSNNRIHYPVQNEIFASNAELLILDLSGNKLSSFSPKSLVGLQRLEVLDLHNNLLVSFPPDLLSPLPLTVVMCIGDNHWDCSCGSYSAFIQRYLDGPGNTPQTCRGGVPECMAPPAVYGKLFLNISGEEELCSSDEEVSSSTITATTDASTSEETTLRYGNTTRETTITGKTKVTKGNDGTVKTEAAGRILPVVHQEDEEGIFLTKDIVTYGVIILGGMLLIIFFLLVLVSARMASKRSLVVSTVDGAGFDGHQDPPISPWPLLQTQRRLPTIEPIEEEVSCSSDYQEIPVKFVNCDYRDYRREEKVVVGEKEAEKDELLGATGESVYMKSIGNESSNARPYGGDAYIPMHASTLLDVPMRHSDLYAPWEA